MRASRLLLAAVAIAAVLAVALIVGFQLDQRQQGVAAPSAPQHPSDTGLPFVDPRASASATPTPTRTGTALLNDRFGFIISTGGAFQIRSETGTRIGEFSGFAPAISPNGRQVAYWQGNDAFAVGPGPALRVIDPAKPSDARTLLTLPASERGGPVLWSPDGTALVIAVYSAESFDGIDGGPKVASLRTLNVGGGAPREIAQLTNGRVLIPVAWDQKAGMVGAEESGAGGFMSAYD